MQHMLIVCKFLHTIEKKGTKKISFTVGCTWNVCLRYVPLFFPILFFSSFHLCFLWMIIFTLRCLKFSLIYSLLCFEFDVTSIIWLWSAFKFIKILHIFRSCICFSMAHFKRNAGRSTGGKTPRKEFATEVCEFIFGIWNTDLLIKDFSTAVCDCTSFPCFFFCVVWALVLVSAIGSAPMLVCSLSPFFSYSD